MAWFKQKVRPEEALEPIKAFIFANAAEVLAFIVNRGDPFILRPDMFVVRSRGHFDRNWYLGAFYLADRFDKPQSRFLRQYSFHSGQVTLGDVITCKPIDEFAKTHDVSGPDERYNFLRIIFDASMNHRSYDRGEPVVDATKIQLFGPIFQEFLTCARYIDHICDQVRVVT